MKEDDKVGKAENAAVDEQQRPEKQRPPRIKVRTELQGGEAGIGGLGGNGTWNP
jgi:hypothetical protein